MARCEFSENHIGLESKKRAFTLGPYRNVLSGTAEVFELSIVPGSISARPKVSPSAEDAGVSATQPEAMPWAW